MYPVEIIKTLYFFVLFVLINLFEMKIRFVLLFSLLLLFSIDVLTAQSPSANELIEKSMKYHDPQGKLLKKEISMFFIETRPNGEDRKSSIMFSIPQESFSMKRTTEEGELISKIQEGKTSFSLNGSTEISEESKEKYRLSPERLTMMKDYYQYLWLLPMKLMDQGTIIDPKVKRIDFFGKDLLQIRVSYEESVGKDIWYFYFHPETYALQGYRFYHDEAKNDGEYIILEEEVVYKKVRLPKKRTWYTHKEDKLLGTDILDSIKW